MREFLVVFLGLALFGGSFIYARFSERCVHCQQSLGKWLIELPSDNPFRIDPIMLSFVRTGGNGLTMTQRFNHRIAAHFIHDYEVRPRNDNRGLDLISSPMRCHSVVCGTLKSRTQSDTQSFAADHIKP
jgi:hypothetical protein